MPFITPLFESLIELLASVVNDYFVSFLIITFLLKLLIAPLSIKQMVHSKVSKHIHPELSAVKKEYFKDKKVLDKKESDQLRTDLENVYNTYGINRGTGCFINIMTFSLNLLVLFSLYKAAQNVPSLYDYQLFWFELGKRDSFMIIPITCVIIFNSYLQLKRDKTTSKRAFFVIRLIISIFVLTLGFFFPSIVFIYWLISYIILIPETILSNYNFNNLLLHRRNPSKAPL
ncbi:MAG: YidC/Oxa1 family membrane protein insertase [Anaerobacillus sp.]